MSTIAAVIDRLYRTYLEPPSYQPITASLADSMTAGQGTAALGRWALPEDKELMRTGNMLEIDSELCRVIAYDYDTDVATITREEYGTTATTHQVDTTVRVGNPYTRHSVFEAISDRIIGLYPDLYTVKTIPVAVTGQGVAPMPDTLAVAVIRVRADNGYGPELQGQIVDYHPAVDGRAVLINGAFGTGWVTYSRRMAKPTSEDDTLEDLGVDERWAGILLAGAAADVLVGADIPEMQTQWIGQALKAESIEIGKRQNIGFGLAQYAEMLTKKFASEMTAEYRPAVRMRSPFDTPVRSVTG